MGFDKNPIYGIFQSSSRTFQAALKRILDENLDIFDDRELLDHLFEEIPVMMKILAFIKPDIHFRIVNSFHFPFFLHGITKVWIIHQPF